MSTSNIETPTIVETPVVVIERNREEESKNKNVLVAKFNALALAEAELKEASEKCLALTIDGQEDKDGYKVARTELTKLVSLRTGIDKSAVGYFDLVKTWKTKGDNEVARLKLLVADAEKYVSKIVKDWKTADDLRLEKERAKKAKLLKDRTLALENAGATLKGGFFLLDEISISLEKVKKQTEDRFEIVVEEFQEKNDALIILAETREVEILAIDPTAKISTENLKTQTAEQFQEYKELISLRAEKNKKPVVADVPDMGTGNIAEGDVLELTEDKAEPNNAPPEDVKEEKQELDTPTELLGKWFAAMNQACCQDLNVYKLPEKDILKDCKMEMITAFSKALGEMKKIG